MKYCSNCGNQLEDSAIICVKCGCAANDSTNNHYESGYNPYNSYDSYGGGDSYGTVYQVYDMRESWPIAILSFLMWKLGVIFWFAWRHTSPGKAKSATKGILARNAMQRPVLGLILWLLWKGDSRRNDYAKIAGIFTIVGASFIAVAALTVLMLNLFGVTLEIPPVDMGIFGSNAAAFISRFTV